MTRRTPSQDVESALLAAAERVLAREGSGGLTVRAVAAEAGVAPMGVYNRFGSKDGLLAAVVIRAFDLLRVAVDAAHEGDPVRRLLASGRAYRRFALDHPQHYALIFATPAAHDVETRPDVEEHARAAFEALVGHVVRGVEAGVLRPGDPVEQAQQIWSAVHGAVSLELGGLILTAAPEATYESLLRLLVEGLSA